MTFVHQTLYQIHILVDCEKPNTFQTIWFPLCLTPIETSHYRLFCCSERTENKIKNKN